MIEETLEIMKITKFLLILVILPLAGVTMAFVSYGNSTIITMKTLKTAGYFCLIGEVLTLKIKCSIIKLYIKFALD